MKYLKTMASSIALVLCGLIPFPPAVNAPSHLAPLAADGGKGSKGRREPAAIVGAIFSPNNKFLFLKYWENSKRRDFFEPWDLIREKKLPLPVSIIKLVAFLPNGRDALVVEDGEMNQTIHLCDVASGKIIRTFEKLGQYDQVRALSISGDGKRALSGHPSGYLMLWDLERGKRVWKIVGTKNERWGGVAHVQFLSDSKRAVSVDFLRSVTVWDIQTSKPIHTFEDKKRLWSSFFAQSPDGKWAISAPTQGDVTRGRCPLIIWEVATGKEVRRLNGEKGTLWAAAFLQNKRRLLTATNNGTLKLWDIPKGKLIRSRQIKVLSLSANGKLAVVLKGEVIKLWDTVAEKFLPIRWPRRQGAKIVEE